MVQEEDRLDAVVCVCAQLHNLGVQGVEIDALRKKITVRLSRNHLISDEGVEDGRRVFDWEIDFVYPQRTE